MFQVRGSVFQKSAGRDLFPRGVIMILLFDLFAIDGMQLGRAGEKISQCKLLALDRRTAPTQPVSLADARVLTDLENSLKHPRYRTILTPPDINVEILETMRHVILPEAIIREFRKMRREMPYTYQHILRTAIVSTKISMDAQVREDFGPVLMAESSLIHDLGKSRIPVGILNKTSPLTADEYALMRSHPVTGYALLHYYLGPGHRLIEDPSFEHHERLDGTGYPRHVRKMNKYSQVIAVADIFDTLISHRPYRREPFTLRAALDYLLDEAKEGRLNPVYVRLLISYARKSKPALRDSRLMTMKSHRTKTNPPKPSRMKGAQRTMKSVIKGLSGPCGLSPGRSGRRTA